MSENLKSALLILAVISLIPISYYIRESRNDEIEKNSGFAIGHIYKKTWSLKNGNQWHYRFYYHPKWYTGYKSDHVDYDISVNDYFLIEFSTLDPQKNKIHFNYKLKEIDSITIKAYYDTIPFHLNFNSVSKK